MQINDFIVDEKATVLDAMKQIDHSGQFIVFVAPKGKLTACVTDSDIRHHILRGGTLQASVSDVANYKPISSKPISRAGAKEILDRRNIQALPIINEDGVLIDIVFRGDFAIKTSVNLAVPVVIMAGGLGTRLYPYTKILPKPLIPIGELPIAEHIINRFVNVGCSDIYLVVNHKKNMIKSYFNDLEKEYALEFIDEQAPLGTGGGIALLRNKITETFFLTNCDILIDADYESILKHHKKENNDVTMVSAFKHFVIPYGVIDLDQYGQIENFREKPELSFLTNTGFYVVEPCVISLVADNEKLGFTDIMERVKQKGKKVGIYPVSEHCFMDMGQLEELDEMSRRLKI